MLKYIEMNKLGELLTRKHLEWQASTGKRKTVEEFSDHIGVSRPLLTMWMNGTRHPSAEKIERLAELFGFEIYDALDLPRPDENLHYVQAHWVGLPVEAIKKIRDIVEKYSVKE